MILHTTMQLSICPSISLWGNMLYLRKMPSVVASIMVSRAPPDSPGINLSIIFSINKQKRVNKKGNI